MKEEFDNKTLITKLLAGEITEYEFVELKNWLRKDAANRRSFNDENELWQLSDPKAGAFHFNTEKGWSDISRKLGISKTSDKNVITLKRNIYRILIAAASIALLISIGGLTLWLNEIRPVSEVAVATTKVFTNEGEKSNIILPDSTFVIMNSASIIEYSADYNNVERKIKLSGESFFDVRTNPEKPFVVELNNMLVSATGTRFNILSYNNENRTEITLEEGKVQVSLRDKEALEVKPGQQLVYFAKTNTALIRDVSTETYISWVENKLRFSDTPFEEVLRKIGRRYNVIFEIRNRELLELKYTATFIDESIEDVMEMLKVVSPISYKILYRTEINDKQYLKPKIILEKRKVRI